MGRDMRYEGAGPFECCLVYVYPFISAYIHSYQFILGLYLAHICTHRRGRQRRGRARTRRTPTAQSDAVIVGVARRRITEVIAKAAEDPMVPSL